MKRRSFLQLLGLAPAAAVAPKAAEAVAKVEELAELAKDEVPLYATKMPEMKDGQYDIYVTCSCATIAEFPRLTPRLGARRR